MRFMELNDAERDRIMGWNGIKRLDRMKGGCMGHEKKAIN